MSARIGVVGAGVMGAGIAQVLAVSGCDVVCYDIDEGALKRAGTLVREGRYGLDGSVERGRLTAEEAAAALGRLTFTAEFDAVTVGREVLIEAVPEDLALKVTLFRRLDEAADADAVLASNSSGFPIAALAAATSRPEAVIGWHWASPVVPMALAEIVRTPTTAAATVERVCALARSAGKRPIVVNDQPMAWGYVANRVYAKARAEAQAIVAEGVATEEQVDQLMIDAFRWSVGPFGMVRGATTGWSGPGPG